jgi:excisionase family DNA binding protein
VEQLLTAREVAEAIGFKAGTVIDWAERNELPHFKISGRLRFSEAEVIAWLETRRRTRRRTTVEAA